MDVRADIDALLTYIYQSWYANLLGYALRWCGDAALAEDLVQETLLALYRDLVKGVAIENPRGWTLTVLRHKTTRATKHERSRAGERSACRVEDKSPETRRGNPALMLLASDELAHLLARLTRREEEVVLLRLEGLKYAEIANQLGVHVSSVKTLVARAIQKVQAHREGRQSGGASLHVERGAQAS